MACCSCCISLASSAERLASLQGFVILGGSFGDAHATALNGLAEPADGAHVPGIVQMRFVQTGTPGAVPTWSVGSALRLTAQVQGLGPKFKIKLNLQNTGSKAVSDLAVAVNFNALLYRVKSAIFAVPLLVPGLVHRIDAELECIDENGTADVVRVYVCPMASVVPILSAIVNMPQSEMLLNSSES